MIYVINKWFFLMFQFLNVAIRLPLNLPMISIVTSTSSSAVAKTKFVFNWKLYIQILVNANVNKVLISKRTTILYFYCIVSNWDARKLNYWHNLIERMLLWIFSLISLQHCITCDNVDCIRMIIIGLYASEWSWHLLRIALALGDTGHFY